MKATVKFNRQVTEKDSFELTELANLIESDYGLTVERHAGSPEPGYKDGGLVVGITITLSVISTLISGLTYWRSTRPKTSIAVSRGDVTVTIDNVPPDKVPDVVAKLEAPQLPEQIEVIIDSEDDE